MSSIIKSVIVVGLLNVPQTIAVAEDFGGSGGSTTGDGSGCCSANGVPALDFGGFTGFGQGCGSCAPDKGIVLELLPGEDLDSVQKRADAEILWQKFAKMPVHDQQVVASFDTPQLCKTLGSICGKLKPVEIKAIVSEARAKGSWWDDLYRELFVSLSAALVGGLLGVVVGRASKSKARTV